MHDSPLCHTKRKRSLASPLSIHIPDDMASTSSFLTVALAVTMAAALLCGSECHAARLLAGGAVKDDLPAPLPPPLPVPFPPVPLPLPPVPEVPGVPLPPLPSAVP
jgi:hypothetical protein